MSTIWRVFHRINLTGRLGTVRSCRKGRGKYPAGPTSQDLGEGESVEIGVIYIVYGKNTAKIKEYIANQIEEDKTVEQMTITELLDPFKQ